MTRYRVCGDRAVLGHRPGDEFNAHISDVQEDRLVKGGHIERVSRNRKETGPDDAGAPDQAKEQ